MSMQLCPCEAQTLVKFWDVGNGWQAITRFLKVFEIFNTVLPIANMVFHGYPIVTDTVLFNPLCTVRRARFGNTFPTTVAPFLNRLSLLGVTFGGLEKQLAGPKTYFGGQGAP